MAALNPKMMEIVFSWCNGSSFIDICKLANVYEGSIIRCFRRLDELLRELSDASKSIGNIVTFVNANLPRSSKLSSHKPRKN
jgi:ATP-dependent RNA helicase DOB1